MKKYPASQYQRKTEPKDKAAFDVLYQSSLDDSESFWAEQSKKLDWFQPWKAVQTGSLMQGDLAWFQDGKLNVCYNCVDRHIKDRGEDVAFYWEGNSPGHQLSMTYHELYINVCQCANALKARGVKRGDRVCLYMPMIPEAVIAMLACARIGAVHCVVFGGFSSEALAHRMQDAQAVCLITSYETLRGEKNIPFHFYVNEALQHCPNVHSVFMLDLPLENKDQRYVDYHAFVSEQSELCPCEAMDAEDPFFILYTSGSTGKPKGILHTTAGYLLYATVTFQMVFDYSPGEIYWCTADIGWITGHSYVVYAPLCNRATSVLYEGVPSYPDMSRYWQIIDKYQVNIFYTAPTALRMLMAAGDQALANTRRTSLRCLGSVGEPINPEVWEWYFHRVGHGHCPIMDTWWQTETGGFLITPLAGITDLKPGSATLPFLGIDPEIIEGDLYIKNSWPGQMRAIYGDQQRLLEYFSEQSGKYFSGDGAYQDEEAYYWITGRVDDVIKVSGHRIGSVEIENIMLEDMGVAEAAAIGIAHPIKGESIVVFVVLKQSQAYQEAELVIALKDRVKRELGSFAVPETIYVVKEVPKTRSGKIMRRLLRKIASGETDLGDISTLANPEAVKI